MAKEVTVKINADTSQAVAGVNNLNKSIQQTGKEAENVKSNTSGISGVLDKVTGGGISKLKSFTGALGGVAGGFKGVGVAIASSGLGLLVVLISSIIQAFKSSEEGQNKFAKLMGVIGSVIGNVTDVLSDIGEVIIGIFSGDSEAIKGATEFGKKIFDVVGLPIKNLIDIVKTAANVIQGLWNNGIDGALDALDKGIEDVKGNFKEAGDAINEAKDALVKFGEEAIREAEIAQQIADQRANADKLDRKLIVDRANAQRKIAELRDKAARADLFSLEERKKALLEASKINEEITNQEIESAKLRRDAIIEENKLSKSNKEALDAEEEAKARVIQLETKRLNLQKRLGTEIASLNNQEASRQKAQADARQKENEKAIQDEEKRLGEIQKLRQKFTEENENLNAKTEEEKLALDRQRAQDELDALIGSEKKKREAQAELNAFYDQQEDELASKRRQERDEAFTKQLEKEKAERKKAAEDQAKLDEIVNQNKVSIAKDTVSIIQGELEKGSAASKGLAAAQTIFDTQQGITSALAAKSPSDQLLPFPVRLANAALVGVKGALALKNILSTNPKTGAGGGSGDGGGAAPAQQAPAFNLVGAGGVNQIQESLETEQQPIQAFVVSGNVTSAQELERNQIDSASIG